jgi:LPXTG-motif cell wall-anchored protein
MRIRFALRVLPALLGALLLVAVPAAQAAETLLLSCTICTQLVATGKGLPANQNVVLAITDLKTGKQVGPRHTVKTDSEGVFVAKIPMDLGEHQSVESTVWKADGQLLVVAAHDRFTAPCKKGGMMEEMGGEMGEAPHSLAFTGSHASQLLTAGAVLLLVGVGLILGARRRRLTH